MYWVGLFHDVLKLASDGTMYAPGYIRRYGVNMTIPSTLASFFQEYDLATLDPQSAALLIFERTLQYEDRADLHWLFAQSRAIRSASGSRTLEKDASRSRISIPGRLFWRSSHERPILGDGHTRDAQHPRRIHTE
jgi:hypothetical protein